MNCSIDEQKLYELCDGLLDDNERTALLAHLSTCPRCLGMYEDARRSLSLLKQPAPDQAFLSQEKVQSIISDALDKSDEERSAIITFPKREFLYAAAAALVVVSVVSAFFLFGTPGKNTVVSTAAGPERMMRPAKDTTVVFDAGCAIRLVAGAEVSMRRSGPRVVHFNLAKGGVFVAAHKGLYDTIAVDCRSMIVLATGTHFSVSKNDSFVCVSVLEGTVKLVHRRSTKEMSITTLETCTAPDSDADAEFRKERMPGDVQNQLAENFAAMGCSDCAAFPLPGTTPGFDDAGDVLQKSPVSARTGTYGEIRKLMRKGDYQKAISELNAFLNARPRDPDVAYCDLALCYCKTDQWDLAVDAYAKAAGLTNDRLVKEAILHRTNHILFSKLLRYAEAEKGIRTYLALYPHGTWRQRELGLLARLERAQHRH